MTAVDPAAAQLMETASAVLVRNDVIARQRTTIWALVTALKASQRAQAELTDLLDSVLSDLDGG